MGYRERGTKFITQRLQTAGPSCLKCYESRSQAGEQRGWVCGIPSLLVVVVERGGEGQGLPSLCGGRDEDSAVTGPSSTWILTIKKTNKEYVDT